MAITNFIEFATDRIHPEVFTEYQNSGYADGDFTGADGSTLDFTKLGWMISIREKMRVENTLTDEVDTLINDMFSMNATDATGTKPNYLTLSNGNYNLLQQIVFDNRSNPDFNFDFSYITSFSDAFDALLYEKFDDNQLSAAEMIIEYGLNNAASVLDITKAGASSTESLASKRFSMYMFAYQKAASEFVSIPNGTGKAAKVLNVIRSKIDTPLANNYNEFFYPNPMSQSSATYPKNELSRMFSFLSHDLLEAYVGKMITDLGVTDPAPLFVSAIKSAVTGTSGLGATQVSFNAEEYQSTVEANIPNNGYSPLYFYISRHKSECRKTILDEISKAFSPFAISIGVSLQDGFTPLGLLSSYLKVNENNEWNSSDIANFIKEQSAGFATMSNAFESFAALGSVRDFTGGKTNNAFGVANNIMNTINSRHSAWWAEKSAEEGNTLTIDDFNTVYDSLISSVLSGNSFSYANYKIWTFEYGKEVS